MPGSLAELGRGAGRNERSGPRRRRRCDARRARRRSTASAWSTQRRRSCRECRARRAVLMSGAIGREQRRQRGLPRMLVQAREMRVAHGAEHEVRARGDAGGAAHAIRDDERVARCVARAASAARSRARCCRCRPRWRCARCSRRPARAACPTVAFNTMIEAADGAMAPG